MREWITYLGEIVLITAVSGLLYHVAPEGALKKHLHFVISLCVLVSLAVPMFSMVMDLPRIFEESFEEAEREGEDTGARLEEALISASQREIEEATASYIAGKYGIPSTRIAVKTALNAEDPEAIEIERIDVVLRGEVSVSAQEIRRDLDELFLGKSEITVSFER